MGAKLIPLISIWMILWLSIAGGSIYLMPLLGANQLNNFYYTTAYFYLCALCGLLYYKVSDTLDNHVSFTKQTSAIVIYTFIVAMLSLLIDRFEPLTPMRVDKIMLDGFYFPLFKFETITTKLADITFQQVFIFAMIKQLKNFNLENNKIILYFSGPFLQFICPWCLPWA